MTLRFVVAAMVVAACSQDNVAPYTPLARAAWTRFPPDDELVGVIVGTGGTQAEREDVAAAVRDVLVPELHRRTHDDVVVLQRRLEDLRGVWDLTPRHSATMFKRFVLEQRVKRIAIDATVLAEVRLHDELWPNEPYPDAWDGDRARAITQPDVAATKLGDELDQLLQRWGATITAGRSYAVATNMIHVARTGDHAKTAEQVYKVLNERRIGTTLDADTIGPW